VGKADTEGQLARSTKLGKFLGICAAVLSFQFATSAWAVERQVVRNSASAAALQLQPMMRLAGDKRLNLAIALPLRNAKR